MERLIGPIFLEIIPVFIIILGIILLIFFRGHKILNKSSNQLVQFSQTESAFKISLVGLIISSLISFGLIGTNLLAYSELVSPPTDTAWGAILVMILLVILGTLELLFLLLCYSFSSKTTHLLYQKIRIVFTLIYLILILLPVLFLYLAYS